MSKTTWPIKTALTIHMLAEQAHAYFALSGTRLNQPSSLVGNVNVAAIDRTHQKCSTKKDTRLCFYHTRYGTDARKCTQNNCPMSHLTLAKNTASGKCQRRSPVAMVAGATNSRLLHIQDRASGHSFFIDTGAEVSLVPASPADHRAAVSSTHSAPLVAANGTEIKTYGTRCLPLKFGNKCFQMSFIVADVNQAILGADFLRANGLLVDLGGQRLVHSATYATIIAPSIMCLPVPLAMTKPPQVNSVYANLLTSRPKPTELTFCKDRIPHGVKLCIDTGQSPPIRSPARRLSPNKLAVAKVAFKEMEDLGIIRRSSSQWASPLHIAPKPGGGWRPCGDFRRLNGSIKADCYPVPHIQDFASQLSGKMIFSKIDLI